MVRSYPRRRSKGMAHACHQYGLIKCRTSEMLSLLPLLRTTVYDQLPVLHRSVGLGMFD